MSQRLHEGGGLRCASASDRPLKEAVLRMGECSVYPTVLALYIVRRARSLNVPSVMDHVCVPSDTVPEKRPEMRSASAS